MHHTLIQIAFWSLVLWLLVGGLAWLIRRWWKRPGGPSFVAAGVLALLWFALMDVELAVLSLVVGYLWWGTFERADERRRRQQIEREG
jgi:hypothetical protein